MDKTITIGLREQVLNRWVPNTDSDRAAVTKQVARILDSVHFSASKRYPNFLSFIVDRELTGHGDELKERTIGVELFGRPLTYDTNADPVVRVTAAEVRRRLKQYYLEPAHAGELRICVSKGSYAPHFERSPAYKSETLENSSGVSPADSSPTEAGSHSSAPEREPTRSSFSNSAWKWMLCATVVLAFVAAIWTNWVQKKQGNSVESDTALKEFWRPFAENRGTVVVSFGMLSMLHPSLPAEPTPEMSLLDAVQRYNIVALPSAVALSKITWLLGEQHVKWRVISADTTTFEDVQAGPTILIGAFSNQWTLRLTSRLRFSFQDSETISRILDNEAKIQPDWLLYRSKSYSSLVQDYGIVARYRDSTTGNLVVIAAGVGPNGTAAAGDFITDKRSIEELIRQAPPGWGHENVEAVIATQVINGKSGPPRIAATSFW